MGPGSRREGRCGCRRAAAAARAWARRHLAAAPAGVRAAAGLLAALAAVAAAVWLLSAGEPPPAELVILHTSDTHGAYLPSHGGGGSWPRLAAAIRREVAAAGGRGRCLLVDCGDTFQGSFEASLDRGAAAVRAMDALGYDAFVPGNHDFDHGVDEFLRRVRELSCPTLAANLAVRDGRGAVHALRGWTMLRKAGLQVAVVGAASPFLSQWLWEAGPCGAVKAAPLPTGIARACAEAAAAGADVIILAVHASTRPSPRLGPGGDLREVAEAFPNVSLILAGHTHAEKAGERLAAGGAWLTQPPPHCGGLARAVIRYDTRRRRVLDVSSRIVRASWSEEDAAVAAAVAQDAALWLAAGAEPLGVWPAGASAPAERRRLLARALAAAAGAEAGACGAGGSAPDGGVRVDARGLFRLLPYEDAVVRLWLTREEALRIVREQRECLGDSRAGHALGFWGPLFADPLRGEDAAAAGRRTPAAFSSYDVRGAGGRFPVLKSIGESPLAAAEPAGGTVREAAARLLREGEARAPPR